MEGRMLKQTPIIYIIKQVGDFPQRNNLTQNQQKKKGGDAKEELTPGQPKSSK